MTLGINVSGSFALARGLTAARSLVPAVPRLVVERWLGGLRGTLAVNVLGSAALGALVHASASTGALLGIGFCGALMTYSTFAVEAARTRSWRYVLASVVLCVSAAALTRSVGR